MIARPLDDETKPTRCVKDPSKFCDEHTSLARTATVGRTLIKISFGAVPVLLLILLGVMGFFHDSINTVEAKQDGIEHSVNNIEHNLKRYFIDNDYVWVDAGHE